MLGVGQYVAGLIGGGLAFSLLPGMLFVLACFHLLLAREHVWRLRSDPADSRRMVASVDLSLLIPAFRRRTSSTCSGTTPPRCEKPRYIFHHKAYTGSRSHNNTEKIRAPTWSLLLVPWLVTSSFGSPGASRSGLLSHDIGCPSRSRCFVLRIRFPRWVSPAGRSEAGGLPDRSALPKRRSLHQHPTGLTTRAGTPSRPTLRGEFPLTFMLWTNGGGQPACAGAYVVGKPWAPRPAAGRVDAAGYRLVRTPDR